jgi:cobalt-zinc-cadmium resistance protein CzcA
LDTAVVIVNLLCIGVGGVWALKIADLNFNISAAVGFVSILGVSVMNSLILISSFNSLRAQGLSLEDSLRIGFRARIRPLMMTLLTAILGLLPAAFSTRIGAQSQRPLAVVVVGGMLFTIVCMVLVPVLYSFYGSRTPPSTAGDLEH